MLRDIIVVSRGKARYVICTCVGQSGGSCCFGVGSVVGFGKEFIFDIAVNRRQTCGRRSGVAVNSVRQYDTSADGIYRLVDRPGKFPGRARYGIIQFVVSVNGAYGVS